MSRCAKSELARKLEGQYFVFAWTDHDFNYEGSCLAVFKLKRGELIGIAGYNRYAEEMEFHGEEISERIVQELIKRKINEVYSLIGHPNRVFGIDTWICDRNKLDRDGAIDEWSTLESICSCDIDANLLEKNGIKIKFVDYETGEISD